MQKAMAGVSQRRGVLETQRPLQPYDNSMLRFTSAEFGSQALEFYAKVICRVDGPGARYLLHFTSIPPIVPDLAEATHNQRQTSLIGCFNLGHPLRFNQRWR